MQSPNSIERLDAGITFQPITPESDSTIVIDDVGPTASDWLPRCLNKLLPHLADDLLTVCQATLDLDPTKGYEKELAEFLQNNSMEAYGGEFARLLARYTLRYHRLEKLGDARQAQKASAESLLSNFATGRATYLLGDPTWEEFQRGYGILFLILEKNLDEWTLPHLVFDFDGDEWLDSTHPRTRNRSLQYLLALGRVAPITICTTPAVERRIRLRHADWIEAVTEYCNPAHRPPHGVASTPLREAYDQLVTMKSRTGKVSILMPFEDRSTAPLSHLYGVLGDAYSRSTIRRYAGELADDHEFLQHTQNGNTTRYSLTTRGRAAIGLVDDDSSEIRIRHPLSLSEEAGYNSAACTVYGTRRDKTGLQPDRTYSENEERHTEGDQ
ncbi:MULTISPECIES: hypothetical protein [Halobacterium]|uniref:hypothetical protein n=1 Tax=Halobacterium TaxID=2239 RepID=UPI00073F64AD|nr:MULTISPECIES: hypothetical protein [Halobacterium]MCG1001905.1 hypothetical protein [Halobacterium noricense]